MGKPVTRITDFFTNPLLQGAPGPIFTPGSFSLFVRGMPVIHATDVFSPIPDMAIPGATTVFHDNLPLCSMGGTTAMGGVLLTGEFTVLIG